MTYNYDDTIGFLITNTSKDMTKFLNNQLRKYDITIDQWSVMKRLIEHNSLTQKDLSIYTNKDQAAITRIITILLRKNLVYKDKNNSDKRSYFLMLTEEGLELEQKIDRVIQDIFENYLVEGLSKEQRLNFIESMNIIRDNIRNFV